MPYVELLMHNHWQFLVWYLYGLNNFLAINILLEQDASAG
jgi:hypothetical protein